MSFDKEDFKQELTLDDVNDLLFELGGDPILLRNEDKIISRTICHHDPYEGSHKLYYYNNSKKFTCYTDCGESFDIFSLIIKVKEVQGEEFNLPQAINFLCSFYGISQNSDINIPFSFFHHKDWDFLEEYQELNNLTTEETKEIFLEEKKDIIKYYPQKEISSWKKEGISKNSLKLFNIKFDPIQYNILIPHYDINNRLIGIRQRTLIKELEASGKYKPFFCNGVDYRHPLGFNLYGLNITKENIRKVKKAIVFEGEKSVLIFDSFFGTENNISCATCGCNLKKYHIYLLLSLGVEEIIIAYDKQFQSVGDEEYQNWIKKLIKIKEQYYGLIKITFMFDKRGDILNYKSSPIDEGKEKFLKLLAERC